MGMMARSAAVRGKGVIVMTTADGEIMQVSGKGEFITIEGQAQASITLCNFMYD